MTAFYFVVQFVQYILDAKLRLAILAKAQIALQEILYLVLWDADPYVGGVCLRVLAPLVEIYGDAIASHGTQAHQVRHVLVQAVKGNCLSLWGLGVKNSLVGVEAFGEIDHLFHSL